MVEPLKSAFGRKVRVPSALRVTVPSVTVTLWPTAMARPSMAMIAMASPSGSESAPAAPLAVLAPVTGLKVTDVSSVVATVSFSATGDGFRTVKVKLDTALVPPASVAVTEIA